MENTVINAVKRLERAGSENSRATQKLFEAAKIVADSIEENVPAGVRLPRGYIVRRVQSNLGSEKFLCRGTDDLTVFVDGIGGYLHGDFQCWIPAQNRKTVLDFAADIASGLLDEIAAWLEERATQANKAAEVLLSEGKNEE